MPERKNVVLEEKVKIFENDLFIKKINQLLPEIEVSQEYLENALMQPNEISRASYGMTLNELKTFSYLIKSFKVENRNFKNRNFIFNLNEILSEINISYSGGAIKNAYLDMVDKMATKRIVIETNKIYHNIQIFEETIYNKETSTVYFSFTEPFAKILERKDGGKFTLLDFDEMLRLNSFYSIRFYQFAMSFKGFKGKFRKPNDEWFKKNIKNAKDTWVYGYSIEQLKFLFDLQDKYKCNNKKFLQKVIEEPFKELNEKIKNYEFKFQEKRKNDKPNGKIEGIIFWTTEKNSTSTSSKTKTIKQEKNNFDILNYDDFIEEQKIKKEQMQNEELKPILLMKEKYSEEFEKRLSIEKSKQGILSIPIIQEKNVYDSMIEDGFLI